MSDSIDWRVSKLIKDNEEIRLRHNTRSHLDDDKQIFLTRKFYTMSYLIDNMVRAITKWKSLYPDQECMVSMRIFPIKSKQERDTFRSQNADWRSGIIESDTDTVGEVNYVEETLKPIPKSKKAKVTKIESGSELKTASIIKKSKLLYKDDILGVPDIQVYYSNEEVDDDEYKRLVNENNILKRKLDSQEVIDLSSVKISKPDVSTLQIIKDKDDLIKKLEVEVGKLRSELIEQKQKVDVIESELISCKKLIKKTELGDQIAGLKELMSFLVTNKMCKTSIKTALFDTKLILQKYVDQNLKLLELKQVMESKLVPNFKELFNINKRRTDSFITSVMFTIGGLNLFIGGDPEQNLALREFNKQFINVVDIK